MLDASGFQFALMFPQFGYDCGLVHAAALLYSLASQGAPESSLVSSRTSSEGAEVAGSEIGLTVLRFLSYHNPHLAGGVRMRLALESLSAPWYWGRAVCARSDDYRHDPRHGIGFSGRRRLS